MPVEGNGAAARVLLVDDDVAVRLLAKRFLEWAGHDVLVAANPVAALFLLAECGPIDLLVTDVVMQGIPGEQLASMVEERIPGVKVLFISGAPLEAGESQSRFFIQKPFTIATLAAKVRNVLESEPLAV